MGTIFLTFVSLIFCTTLVLLFHFLSDIVVKKTNLKIILYILFFRSSETVLFRFEGMVKNKNLSIIVQLVRCNVLVPVEGKQTTRILFKIVLVLGPN